MVTAKGVPFGVASSATIDASGGTLASADGRLSITIPPGALASATTIGIQPITNEMNAGVWLAYELTPQGQTFAMPITLGFTYADFDLVGTTAQGLRVAYQNGAGAWRGLTDAVLDATNHKVSVDTTHFTAYAVSTFFGLVPTQSTVGLNQEQRLDGYMCDARDDPKAPGERELLNCSDVDDTLDPGFKLTNWSVNGVVGGNDAVGTARTSAVDAGSGVYHAPSQVPTSNPVAVSVTYQPGSAGRAAGLSPNNQLVANVQVVCQLPNQPQGYCPVSYSGSTSGDWADSIYSYHISAQIEWVEKSVNGSLVSYEPTGLVSLSNGHAGDCSLTLQPGSWTPVPMDGQLTINFGVSPPQWSGSASISNWTPTLIVTCPDDSGYTATVPFGAWYFGGEVSSGDLTPGGTGFSGTSHRKGGDLNYTFISTTNPPKAGR